MLYAEPARLVTPGAQLPRYARPATSSATSCRRTSPRRLAALQPGSRAYARKPWCHALGI